MPLLDRISDILPVTRNAAGAAEIDGPVTVLDTLTASGGVTGDVTGNVIATASASQEWGDGAEGTGGLISVSRRQENGVIITETKIDITGMSAAGNTAKDAVGVSGDPCFIGRNVVATDGIVYKIEIICLVTPVGGDPDLDFGLDVSGTIELDGAVDTIVINTASLVAGESAETLAPALTANFYYYLIENAGTAAAYTAGQFIIRTYGHPALA